MRKMLLILLGCLAGAAWAKLPAPSDEAKAKAAEAAAKTAHTGKVDSYKTCLSAEKSAAHYFKTHPGAAKPASPPACADPGPFVPPVATPVVAAPASPPTPPAPVAPTVPPAPVKKP